MPAKRNCSECGAELSPNDQGGLCGRCLLQPGIDVKPGNASAPAADSALTEAPGDYIDRYKLLQKIGEGGCGVVYMADQEEPIRRRVALKVIKPGMDTRAVIARFEAERQALAMMDHPNIAKVLDVGQTATGRPFFVMELVKGVRITEYCDQNNLATRERLALFTQVCHAIQHAHQKGIVHRDIKPSNVLVTLHDGVPVPKVIDFGIAKALHQQHLTDLTLFTTFGQFMGTAAYMSPEQAEMSGLDIDTRCDIYSLGVLLYELLVGTTPFDSGELLRAGLDEMRRIIREQEPVRPSTHLSTLVAARLTTVASHRQCEPARLTHLIRGDLDWIVMKCLEKDRARRYETSSGLAADIQRHLNDEPVLASPPSSLYRLQKTVRRHKLAFAAAGSIALVVLAAAVIASILFVHERTARKRATEAEIEMLAAALKAEQFATAFIGNSGDSGWRLSLGTNLASLRYVTAAWTRDRIQRELADKPALRADLLFYKGRRFKMVETSEIRANPFGMATAADKASVVDMVSGKIPEREAMLNEALRLREALYSADHPAAAEVHEELAHALVEVRELKKAEEHAVAAVAIRKKADPGNREHAAALLTLSDVMNVQGKPAKAQAAIAEAIAIQAKLFHPQALEIGMSHARLARLQQQEGQIEAARDSLKIAVGSLGSSASNSFGLSIWRHLVFVLRKCGNLDEAEQACLQTVSMARNGGKDTANGIGLAFRELALIRKDKHDLAGAVEAAREALAAGQQQGSGILYKRVLGCLLSDLALAKITNGATDSESITAIMKHASEAEDLLLTNPSSDLIGIDQPKNQTAKALSQLKRVYELSGRSNEVIRLQRRAAQSIAESLNEADRLYSVDQEMLKENAEARAKLEAGKLKIP